eukprot:scaffold11463_cov124-Isochrysis_galbana.AAC.9
MYILISRRNTLNAGCVVQSFYCGGGLCYVRPAESSCGQMAGRAARSSFEAQRAFRHCTGARRFRVVGIAVKKWSCGRVVVARTHSGQRRGGTSHPVLF